MSLVAADRQLLIRQLGELSRAVEELVLTGLTTASESTRQTLDVTIREASRLRLLRLAATLRAANEEIGRFVNQQADFSCKRLAFFLNRGWLLASGMLRALTLNDEVELARLQWSPPTRPVDRIEVITLGVGKRVAKNAFCAFEFRFREVSGTTPACLAWSCVFPLQPGASVPVDGYLQMPQKQKFKAAMFLERKVISLTNVLIAEDEFGNGKISLTDTSIVTAQDPFREWAQFHRWSPLTILKRIRQHEPSPFELEVELQDEVVLHDWTIGTAQETERDGQIVYPLSADGLTMEAIVPANDDGNTLRKHLETWREEKSRPPLFGLLHFERASLILQPLSLFESDGPKLLTISSDAIDRAALLKALKF